MGFFPRKERTSLSMRGKEAAKAAIENYFMQLSAVTDYEEKLREDVNETMEELGLDIKSGEKMRSKLKKKIAMDLREARQVMTLESFEPVAVIGKGSFGLVRLVKHIASGQYYAMKQLPKSIAKETNAVARVWAERQALANLDLECVGKLEYCFQDSDNIYLVMEFLSGGDLMTRLLKEEVLSEDEARFYIAELIIAVDSIHRLGVIHRDLKPDNLVLTADGHLKVLDFGLCKSLHDKKWTKTKHQSSVKSLVKQFSSLTVDGRRNAWRKVARAQKFSAVGTPNYIAPEVIMDGFYSEECDWWSVGVILYEMLVGFAPFHSPDISSTCRKVHYHLHRKGV